MIFVPTWVGPCSTAGECGLNRGVLTDDQPRARPIAEKPFVLSLGCHQQIGVGQRWWTHQRLSIGTTGECFILCPERWPAYHVGANVRRIVLHQRLVGCNPIRVIGWAGCQLIDNRYARLPNQPAGLIPGTRSIEAKPGQSQQLANR